MGFFMGALPFLFFMMIRVDSAILKIVLRLLLIPVIAGVSYEFIRLAGRSDNWIVRTLSMPGIYLQKLTTVEPEDQHLEVAIAAMKAVLREDEESYFEGLVDFEGRPLVNIEEEEV